MDLSGLPVPHGSGNDLGELGGGAEDFGKLLQWDPRHQTLAMGEKDRVDGADGRDRSSWSAAWTCGVSAAVWV